MKDSLRAEAVKMIAKRERRKRLALVVLVLGLFATVSVFALLTLPAITMEQEPTCGLTEHDHSEECYGDVLICGLGDALPPPEIISTEVLTCTDPESPGHTHDENCYIEGPPELTCLLPEDEDHTHDPEICFTSAQSLSCSEAESEGHTHSDGCYETIEEIVEPSEEDLAHEHDESCHEEQLICGGEIHAHSEEECFVENIVEDGTPCELEEHAHGEACFDETNTLICELTEHTHVDECNVDGDNTVVIVDPNAPCALIEHAHGEGCYTINAGVAELTCTIPEHVHIAACNLAEEEEIGENNEHYKCGYRTHAHTEDCYTIIEGVKELTCGKVEHAHTDECIDENKTIRYDCGLKAHTHDNDCYVINHGIGDLVCGLPEHTHDGCVELPPEEEKPLFCNKEEHEHEELCYIIVNSETGEKVLNCGLEAHTHSDACHEEGSVEPEYNPYSCGKEDHVHVGDCFKITNRETGFDYYRLELECESEEDLMHVHDEECFKFYETILNCGIEHEHDDYSEIGCYRITELEWDEELFEKELVCEEEEHVHSLYCMSFGQSLMMMPFAIVGGYSTELEDFVTEVAVTHGDGTPVAPGSTVVAGDKYIIQLKFREIPGTAQLKYNNQGILTYTLPSGILPYAMTMPPGGLDGLIKSSSNASVNIGEYKILPSGVIQVKFYNVDTNGATLGQNFIDFYNNAFFGIMIEAEFGAQNGTVTKKIEFGNNININLVINGDARLEIKKVALSYTKGTGTNPGTANYVVTITAKGGPVNTIVLKDDMFMVKADMNQVDGPPIRNRLELINSFTIKRPNGTTYTATASPYSKPNGTFTLNLTGMTLNKDESVEIRYSVRVPADIYTETGVHHYTLENTAAATGRDKDNKPVTPVDDNAYLQIPLLLVTKSVAGDPGYDVTYGNYILWEIIIGDGFTDMSNRTFLDKLIGNHKYLYNFPFYIERKLGAASPWDSDDPRFEHVFGGWGWTAWNINRPTGVTGLTDTQFTFKVPNDNPPGGDKWIYKLAFYTTYDGEQFSGNDKLRNEFYETNGSGVGDFAEVGVGQGTLGLEKNHIKHANKVSFELIANVPGDLKNQHIFFGDYLLADMFEQPGGWWLESYAFQNFAENMRIVVTRKSDGSVLQNVTPYSTSNTGSKWYFTRGTWLDTWYLSYGYNRASLIRNPNAQQIASGNLWPYDFPTVITITYDIPHSVKRVELNNSVASNAPTLGDYLNGDYSFNSIQNGADIFSSNRNEYAHTQIYPMINKLGFWNSDTSTFDYVISLNHGWNMSLSEGWIQKAPVLTDEHDPHLEFVPGSLVVRRTTSLITTTVESTKANFDAVTRGYVNASSKVAVNAGANKWSLDFASILNSSVGGSNGWTIVPQNPTQWGEGYNWWSCGDSSYVVTYSMKIKDGAQFPLNSDGEAFFNNVAWLQTYTNGNIGPKYRSSETVTYKPVSKNMNYTGGVSADVVININTAGDKLAGVGINVIDIHDKMSNNLSLYTTSLMVEVDEGSGWVEKTLVPNTLSVPYGYIIDSPQEFRMKLPDEKPIRLSYRVMLSGDPGDQLSVKNKITVTGFANFADEFQEIFVVSNTSGGGGGDKTLFDVQKIDKYSRTALSGAWFGLYVSYQPPSDVWAAARATVANLKKAESAGGLGVDVKETIVVGGRTYYFIMARQTVNGLARFDASATEENVITGTTYALLELKAPQGYILPTDPTLFALEVYEAGYGASKGVLLKSDSIEIENDPGVKLPETGSTSGVPIIQAGAVVFALAGAVLFTTRRRAGDCS